MNLEGKLNEPIKKNRGISKLTKLTLSAIFALGAAFSLKGCKDDSEPPSYEGLWNISWSWNWGSCNIVGSSNVAVTSGGAYATTSTEDCLNPSHYGTTSTRIYGNINPSSGVIVGSHENGGCSSSGHPGPFTFAGQCDTPTTGSATGSYNFSILFDKQ